MATPSPFTLKGLLVGALLSLFIGIAAPYAIFMIQGSMMTLNISSPAAIFLFFVFTLFINVGLGLIGRRLALGRADLVLVYIMLLLACSVPTMPYVASLITVISGVSYFATPENQWEAIYLSRTPDWLVPKDYQAIKHFYEGLPEGQSIPWGVWVEPLAHWYGFFLVLSFMMICMSTILHRQWSNHERLTYPLAQVPLHMIGTEAGGVTRIGPLFRNKVMWMGFAVPFFMFSLTGLHHYFPFVPDMPFVIGRYYFFRGTIYWPMMLSYAWIGFFYLVNLEITFSIWFFYLLGKIQEGSFNTLGISSDERLSMYSTSQTADLTHQAMGAVLVFVLYGLSITCSQLRAVWRKAWRNNAGVDDSEEVLPYRVAFWGFFCSLLLIAVWLWSTGIPPVVLPLFLGACLVFYIMMTRVVATAGVPTTRVTMVAAYFVISTVGTSIIGTKALVALTYTYVWQSETRLFPMIPIANSLKLAENIPGSKRIVFWAMMVALVCSLAGATWIILELFYTHGGINLQRFFATGLPRRPFTDMVPPIMNATEPDVRGFIFTGIGGLIEGLLMFAHTRFYWWPLHPLGFVISVGWLTGWVWFSVFLSWLLKLIILKYGGGQLFKAARPFFLGLIIGEASVGGFWLVVDWVLGESGNFITFM